MQIISDESAAIIDTSNMEEALLHIRPLLPEYISLLSTQSRMAFVRFVFN